MGIWWKLLLAAALGYGVLAAFLAIFQERQVYFPSTVLAATPDQSGLPYEDVHIPSAGGVRLHGWYLPAPPDGRGKTLLFFHGNAGNISHRLASLAIFHRLGLATLIIDYRGYGRSEGSPSEVGTYRDAAAAWRHLTADRGVPPEDIVLFGRSLGAAIAAHQAARTPPAGLILESAFTSVPDVAEELYPFLPVRWLARIRYDTAGDLARVERPVLIAHSREDEIIPYAHAEALYRVAPGPKTLLTLQGSHNDGFLASGEHYLEGLRRFLDGL
jgi:hypothetical protein